jgi:hypothetical protein
VGPAWCAARFRQSRTTLADGRVIRIAGEHEDYYDADFFIAALLCRESACEGRGPPRVDPQRSQRVGQRKAVGPELRLSREYTRVGGDGLSVFVQMYPHGVRVTTSRKPIAEEH